ncbi:alcohol dehydrogenase catalytic domain-containing protein [Streptomyces sp. NPDC050509]|uniref:alcohol dehydrogenase catalytic domain-containing protein n=1 Tax=Streptomyces sp. NPDC050509 TaxID=3365620 RepID=UPI0037B5A744
MAAWLHEPGDALDLPGGLGSDVAGVVDQVREGVTAFGVGDEVLGASITPSCTQFALAGPAALVAEPASVRSRTPSNSPAARRVSSPSRSSTRPGAVSGST